MSDLPDLSAILSTNLTSFFLAAGAVAIVIFSLVLAFFYFRSNAHFEYKLQLKGDHEDLLRKVQNLEIELKEKKSLKEDVEKKTAHIKSEYEQFAANKNSARHCAGRCFASYIGNADTALSRFLVGETPGVRRQRCPQ